MADLDQSDGELLTMFVERRAQAPFAELVRRHRVMVMSVCRLGTQHEHDAEDAAQRVFLMLAKKAKQLRHYDSVAGWLFRTAQHVGRELRRSNQRRLKREAQASSNEPQHHDPSQHEWREVLDGQLARLPVKYREPIVLHHLQGMPYKQAAQRMGLAEKAFSVRLTRGRELLRQRMVRSGVAFTSAMWASLLVTDEASADAEAPAAMLELWTSRGFFDQAISQLDRSSTVMSRLKLAVVFVLMTVSVAGTTYAFTNLNSQAPQPVGNPVVLDNAPIKETETTKQVAGNRAFAVAMYSKLREESNDKNLFFAPYSISTALGMAYTGSRGKTAQEMAGAASFESKPGRIPVVLSDLTRGMMAQAKKTKQDFQIANGMVLVKPQAVDQAYKKIILEQFDGEIMTGSNPLEIVNNWVKEKTNDKIPSILKELSPQAVLVLLNAVYFNGSWETPFNKKATRQQEFIVAGGKKVKTPMMSQTASFSTFQSRDVQALSLPYKGGQLAMVFLLPGKNRRFAQLEKSITSENLDAWMKKIDQTKPSSVAISVPKFKLESSVDLVAPLKSLGMNDAFEAGRADFSGIGGSPGDLFISQVKHRGFVDVNELGTEAAGATAIEISFRGMPPQFRVNQSFVFVIRDTKTGNILFMGRMIDPTQS